MREKLQRLPERRPSCSRGTRRGGSQRTSPGAGAANHRLRWAVSRPPQQVPIQTVL